MLPSVCLRVCNVPQEYSERAPADAVAFQYSQFHDYLKATERPSRLAVLQALEEEGGVVGG